MKLIMKVFFKKFVLNGKLKCLHVKENRCTQSLTDDSAKVRNALHTYIHGRPQSYVALHTYIHSQNPAK